MSENAVRNEILAVVNYVGEQRELLEEEFTRIQVLVTGTLRLLGQENVSTLRALQSDPEQVKTHLIHSVSQLGIRIMASFGDIESRLRVVSEALRKP